MKTSTTALMFLCLFSVQWAFAQVTFILSSIPEDTPKESIFFLAGTINKWAPNSENYQFKIDELGRLSLTLEVVPDTFEFKISRGSWNTVEIDSTGKDIPNRLYVDSIGKEVHIVVQAWRDRIPQRLLASTASPNVHFTPTSIEIPQFKKRRTVRVYFPPNYTSRQGYPVIYMFDGQNVFDASTSFAGEWKVDETLDSLYQYRGFACIVVAVYHAENDRVTEQTPWPNSEKVGGDGVKFAQFFVKDLKPYIDKHYRTLPGRENTTIIGSSLGGLMALFMALEYPEIFGKAAVFSPSLWWSEKSFEQMIKLKKKHYQKIFLLGGEKESETMVGNLERAEQLLKTAGYDENELIIKVAPDGRHSEWFWAREFPDALTWLFGL
jgi:predicted alpha/beta superfamily hydrolase